MPKPSSKVGTGPKPRRRIAVVVAAAIALLTVAFLWRPRLTPVTSHAPLPIMDASTASLPPSSQIPPPVKPRPSLASMATASANDDAEPATASEPERRARELFAVLTAHVDMLARLDPAGSPESAVDQTGTYLYGSLDAVRIARPELLGELSQRIERSLCDARSTPARLGMAARMILHAPDLGTARGFECLFNRHQAEDALLWSALDAWRASGLPRVEALARIERHATDEQTRQRFLSDREQIRRQVPRLANRLALLPDEPP
jgi:hypothetical protein